MPTDQCLLGIYLSYEVLERFKREEIQFGIPTNLLATAGKVSLGKKLYLLSRRTEKAALILNVLGCVDDSKSPINSAGFCVHRELLYIGMTRL